MVTYFVFGLMVFILVVFSVLWGIAGFSVALLIDLILAALSIRIVSPNTVMAVERLGKFRWVLRQGFHMIIPVIEWTRTQYLWKRNFPVEVEGVTSDNVSAKVDLNVVYYVEDDGDDTQNGNIYKSIYEIDNPETLIKATIDEQLRWMIFHFTHKEIFGKRQEIWEEIENSLRNKLQQFGYRIDSIQVQNIDLDPDVMKAMNKEVETAKLKNAAFNEAEAEKIKKVKAAEADKEAQILLWQGMAWQRMEIAKWFKESIDMIRAADPELTAKAILNFLLDSSRIETLSKIGSRNNAKLIYLNESLEGNSFKNMETKLMAGSSIMDK